LTIDTVDFIVIVYEAVVRNKGSKPNLSPLLLGASSVHSIHANLSLAVIS